MNKALFSRPAVEPQNQLQNLKRKGAQQQNMTHPHGKCCAVDWSLRTAVFLLSCCLENILFAQETEFSGSATSILSSQLRFNRLLFRLRCAFALLTPANHHFKQSKTRKNSPKFLGLITFMLVVSALLPLSFESWGSYSLSLAVMHL